MIDLWWMLIPMFIMWIQFRAIMKLKFIIDNLFKDLEQEQTRHLDTAKTLTKTMGRLGESKSELSDLLRDIADATKVSRPIDFIGTRIRERERAKQKMKDEA